MIARSLTFIALATAVAGTSLAHAEPSTVYGYRSPNEETGKSRYGHYIVAQKRKIAEFLCFASSVDGLPLEADQFRKMLNAPRNSNTKCFQTTNMEARGGDRAYYNPDTRTFVLSQLDDFYMARSGKITGVTPTLNTMRLDIGRSETLALSAVGIQYSASPTAKIWTERNTYLRIAKFQGDLPALRVPDFYRTSDVTK